MSELKTLTGNDFVQSLITGVFGAVIVALGGIVSTPGFNVFSANWGQILPNMVNIAIITSISAIVKAYSTGSNNKTFGKI